jgi:hypothetical protein
VHIIRTTTHDVHRARYLHQIHVVERDRLRRVVERIDKAIEDCELAHLIGFKRVDDRLLAGACAAINLTTRAVAQTKDHHAICRVARNAARAPRTISDLMDALWEIEDTVFDLMIPGRAQLDDASRDEDEEADEEEDEDGATLRIVHLLRSGQRVGSAA